MLILLLILYFFSLFLNKKIKKIESVVVSPYEKNDPICVGCERGSVGIRQSEVNLNTILFFRPKLEKEFLKKFPSRLRKKEIQEFGVDFEESAPITIPGQSCPQRKRIHPSKSGSTGEWSETPSAPKKERLGIPPWSKTVKDFLNFPYAMDLRRN
jgi:hypothetical protein